MKYLGDGRSAMQNEVLGGRRRVQRWRRMAHGFTRFRYPVLQRISIFMDGWERGPTWKWPGLLDPSLPNQLDSSSSHQGLVSLSLVCRGGFTGSFTGTGQFCTMIGTNLTWDFSRIRNQRSFRVESEDR